MTLCCFCCCYFLLLACSTVARCLIGDGVFRLLVLHFMNIYLMVFILFRSFDS